MKGWKLALLVVSMALNGALGWMLVSRRAIAAPLAPPPTARPVDPAPQTSRPAATPSPVGAITPESCPAVLRAERARSAKLERHLPPRIRFDNADSGDTNREASVRPEIERVLGDRQHTVECRGSFCKIEIVTPAKDKGDWMDKLQKDPTLRHMFESRAFHSGTPVTDPVTKEPLDVNDVYVTLPDPDTVSGQTLLHEIWSSVKSAGIVRTCAARSPETAGTIELKLAVDDTAHGFGFSAGGTLGASPVAACIVGELERVSAMVPIPEKLIPAVTFINLTLPDDAR